MEMMVLALCRSSYTLHLLAYKWGSQRIRWVGLLSSNELSNQRVVLSIDEKMLTWKFSDTCDPEFILDHTSMMRVKYICVFDMYPSAMK